MCDTGMDDGRLVNGTEQRARSCQVESCVGNHTETRYCTKYCDEEKNKGTSVFKLFVLSFRWIRVSPRKCLILTSHPFLFRKQVRKSTRKHSELWGNTKGNFEKISRDWKGNRNWKLGKVRIWESIGEIGKWGSLDQNWNMEKPGRTIGSLKIKLNLGNEGPNDYWWYDEW